MGYAHQFHVGKFDPGALIAIIQQHLDTGSFQFRVQLLRALGYHRRLLHVKWHQRDLEGSDTRRPDDALFVVVLFDRGGDNPGHANPVTAHPQDFTAALFVEYLGMHGVAVFRTQLEDVTNLDATFYQQLAAAVRAGITGDNLANILNPFDAAVALPVHAAQVVPVAVGATNKIRQVPGGPIHDTGNIQSHRPQRTDTAAGASADIRLLGKLQRSSNPCHFFRLDGIELMVTAQQ